MSTEQLIIILTGVSVIVVFVLSHSKVSRTWKVFLFIFFLAIVISSTILQVLNLKKKESKQAAHEAKLDRIETHVKASLGFEGHIEAARDYRGTGKTGEAICEVQCALKKDPNSLLALNLLAVLYTDKRDYDSAILAYTKIKKGLADSSTTAGSDKYIYHRNFGKAYMAKNMWTEAKEELSQCLSLNDDDLMSHLYLAKTLDRLNEWHEVYDLCKKGVAKFPDVAPLYNFLGEACISTSRLDEGEAALLKAIQADSTFGQPYLFLAVIYYVRKEHEKSAKLVEKALQLDPSLAEDIEILKDKKLLP